jgi:NlpC/P60 family putative phage cell wall peptidase
MAATRSVTSTMIIATARDWLGTPYHHGASLKGVGCDCLGLIRGVWRELYGTEPEAPGPYTGDWTETTGVEAMLLAARRHMAERPVDRMESGDVLIFRLAPGRIAKHAGFVAPDGRMIHAQEGVPVAEVSLGPWWRRRIAGVFSLPGRV